MPLRSSIMAAAATKRSSRSKPQQYSSIAVASKPRFVPAIAAAGIGTKKRGAAVVSPRSSNAAAAATAAAEKNDEGRKQQQPATTTSAGCLVCRTEDFEEQTLLCEGCEGEYHIFCLQPPLAEVPPGDWYCDNCLEESDDGMDRLVAALPPDITGRFGEIVFAQGGTGYGWWPSIIFDPRLTVEPARSQARRLLGQRHLVYFFQCDDSPFSLLPVKQIKPWFEGMCEDFHLGRVAKTYGKQRYKSFREAFEVACLESEKHTEERLDWEHTPPDPALSSPLPAILTNTELSSSPPMPTISSSTLLSPSFNSHLLSSPMKRSISANQAIPFSNPVRLSPDRITRSNATTSMATATKQHKTTGAEFRQQLIQDSLNDVGWTWRQMTHLYSDP